MSIGKRIAKIVRSWRGAGDDTERLGDRLDESYRTQTALLQQVRRGVADVATSRKRVELQLTALQEQAARLDEQARSDVAGGDDTAARAALTRKVTIERTAADLRARHADLATEEERLRATALQVEQDVEAFRIRKTTLQARHSAAAARAEINSATSGINSSVSEVGQIMASAERRTRELEATADAVDELVAEGIVSRPGESADEALGRQFDAALDAGEVERQLEQITAHGKDGDDGAQPVQG